MLKPFGGTAKLSKKQKIESGDRDVVKFLDKHGQSEYGNITIARGPGALPTVIANVRLKGKAGERVELTMVVERGVDQPQRVLAQARVVLDSLHLAAVQLVGSSPVAAGELVRVYAHPQGKGQGVTVESFSWSGYARAGA